MTAFDIVIDENTLRTLVLEHVKKHIPGTQCQPWHVKLLGKLSPRYNAKTCDLFSVRATVHLETRP